MADGVTVELAAGPGVEDLVAGCLRRAGRLGDIRSAAEARIGSTRRTKRVERFIVQRRPIRLLVGLVRTAQIGTLVPVETEPGEILEDRVVEPFPHSGPIEVFHAHDERAFPGPDGQPCDQRRGRIAEVEVSGGARGVPTSHGPRINEPAERGRLAPGLRADVNVIDFDALSMEVPEFVYDFPAGAGRWTQRARGYDYSIVNGRIAIEQGNHTGRLAGQLVRGA